MNIETIKKEREGWLFWKNIAPLRESIEKISPQNNLVKFENGSVVIDSEIGEFGIQIAKSMKPWRKGPFKFRDVTIDAEWNSNIKYSILLPHLDIKNKIVGDIGCNNGYYMFRMLELEPKMIIGFDPVPLCKIQFDFIDRFVGSAKNGKIIFELLGVEHLSIYGQKFDLLLCLGVIYHRSDPVATLKNLKSALKNNGILILDTFYIEGDDEVALFPNERYAKMNNVYFLPTIPALRNWAKRAKFKEFEVIATVDANSDEQRKTDWMDSESLNDFLDPNDQNKTVEGYQAPKRVFVKLK